MDDSDQNHHGWGHLLLGLLKFACTICVCQLIDTGLLAIRACLNKYLENLISSGMGQADWVFNIIHPILDAFMLLLFLVFFIMELATIIGMVHFVVVNVCANIRREHKKYKSLKLADEKPKELAPETKPQDMVNKPAALEVIQ
jgi:hypothetical protein